MKRNHSINYILITFLFIILAFILCGCKDVKTDYSKSGFAFDTVISITVYDNDKNHANLVLNGCLELCEHYDSLFGITHENSDIYRINSSNGNPVTVSEETIDLIEKSLYYSELSDGLLDITIEPIYKLWDFDGENHTNLPNDSDIQDALKAVNNKNIVINKDNLTITVPNNMKLNTGAVAKGYIADKLKEYILNQGITSSLINLGGNILAIGSKPDNSAFNIGLQKPFSATGEVLTSISVTDKSVVTSGTYQRFFTYNNEIYHHIINPYTGYPIKNELSAVTIIADSSTDADALSTICMLLGHEKATELIDSMDNVSAIFIDNKGNIIK